MLVELSHNVDGTAVVVLGVRLQFKAYYVVFCLLPLDLCSHYSTSEPVVELRKRY
jgi:hypothetical protein